MENAAGETFVEDEKKAFAEAVDATTDYLRKMAGLGLAAAVAWEGTDQFFVHPDGKARPTTVFHTDWSCSPTHAAGLYALGNEEALGCQVPIVIGD